MINSVIDISHYQTVTSFSAIKAAGILGIIHKATEGASDAGNDARYKARRTAALAQGFMWGAFHFGRKEDGKAQADHFLDRVLPDDKTLIALDFEKRQRHGIQLPHMSLDQARDFVTRIHEKTGRWPGLYSGDLIKEDLGQTVDPVLKNCWFWLADYTAPDVPPCWSTWTLWQYTGDGIGAQPHTVNGITGPIERDKFNGTEAELKQFWGY